MRETFFAMILAAASIFAFGAEAQTIRFANTDIEGLEELQREYGAFRDVLEKLTGYEVEFFPVSNRTVAAEALRAEQVDFVLTGPSEYTVITSVTDAEPVVAFSRVDYYSVIVAMADTGIGAPSDLEGKRVAMGDIGSTSTHLGPSQVLADYGLDPANDVEVLNIGSSEAGFQALMRGDVAAWGTSGATYARLRAEGAADRPGDFRVIARGPDLPNDVLMVGSHVDDEIVEAMRNVFVDPDLLAQVHDALMSVGDDKYKLTSFLTSVVDADYDYMREAYRAIGQDQFAVRAGE
ncbi:MAG: phosphate/phosphite/phosphonate ABC transporter substrate-binding protein [Pseudomonadota bacterium]